MKVPEIYDGIPEMWEEEIQSPKKWIYNVIIGGLVIVLAFFCVKGHSR